MEVETVSGQPRTIGLTWGFSFIKRKSIFRVPGKLASTMRTAVEIRFFTTSTIQIRQKRETPAL